MNKLSSDIYCLNSIKTEENNEFRNIKKSLE